MLPRISVIIPVYNHQAALERTLPSVFAQEQVQVEVIVVDDGSTNVVRIPSQYQGRLALIRQINAGAPVARNTGAKQASADFLFFWDADVEAEPLMLKTLHDTLMASPDASYAYCNYRLDNHRMPARSFDADALKQQNYIATMSLIREAAFPGFDPALKRFQDWDLWLTMLAQGKMGVHVDEYLFTAHQERVGISSWLPSFAYKKPFCYLPWWKEKVQAYNEARSIIQKKHRL